MTQGDPWAAVESLASKDKRIEQIVRNMAQMTPSEAFRSAGYDLGQVRSLIDS